MKNVSLCAFCICIHSVTMRLDFYCNNAHRELPGSGLHSVPLIDRSAAQAYSDVLSSICRHAAHNIYYLSFHLSTFIHYCRKYSNTKKLEVGPQLNYFIFFIFDPQGLIFNLPVAAWKDGNLKNESDAFGVKS